MVILGDIEKLPCKQQKKSTCSITSVRIAYELTNRLFTPEEKAIWDDNYDRIQRKVINRGMVMKETLELWKKYKFPSINIDVDFWFKPDRPKKMTVLNKKLEDLEEAKNDLEIIDGGKLYKEWEETRLKTEINHLNKQIVYVKKSMLIDIIREKMLKRLNEHLERENTVAIFSIANFKWKKFDKRVEIETTFCEDRCRRHAITCVRKEGDYYVMHDSAFALQTCRKFIHKHQLRKIIYGVYLVSPNNQSETFVKHSDGLKF